MSASRVRLAHWTDIHVADEGFRNRMILEALGHLTVGVGAIGAAEKLLLERLEHRWRIALRTGVALTGLALAAFQPAIRQRLQFLAWLMQSSRDTHRQLLFESLREHNVGHLLVTGDVSACSLGGELEQFRDELHRYGWDDENSTILPGNHDVLTTDPDSPGFDVVFPRPAAICREVGPGVVLAGLDSTVESAPESGMQSFWNNAVTNLQGGLGADELRQVAAAVSDSPGATFVVGMHHPPCRFRKVSLHASPPHGAGDLLGTLEGSSHMVLCGHSHPRHSRFLENDGVYAVMANATGLARGVRRRLAYWVYELEAGRAIGKEEACQRPWPTS